MFLLDDSDVARVAGWVRARLPAVPRAAALARWRGHLRGPSLPARARRALGWAGVAGWLGVSLIEALFHFGSPGVLADPLAPVLELSETYRLINAYHLFAAVTRQRIEPEFQVQTSDGEAWTPLVFKYKPGPVDRPPPFVAPHQPRVDFLLWFYGLSFARRQPGYVSGLLGRLCQDPGAVASVFAEPPPRDIRSVRLVFWDYGFTTADQRRATGAWWARHLVQSSAANRCFP